MDGTLLKSCCFYLVFLEQLTRKLHFYETQESYIHMSPK